MKKMSSQAGAGKAVGYARVSAAGQAESDHSLRAQMASIRRYAQDHGLELVGEFVDGAATNEARPAYQRMLEETARPSSDIGTIIVTDRSRFMRSAAEARAHKEALRGRGVQIVAIQQQDEQ